MKSYYLRLAVCSVILFSCFDVFAAVNQKPASTTLEITGTWEVSVSAIIEQDGISRNVSSVVTIEPPSQVQVVDELYINLPLYNSNGAGWSNGVPLNGLEAQGCSHYDGLWPETVQVRTGPGVTGILLEDGKDYKLEPRWGVIGLLSGGRVTSSDRVYISYVHTPQRVDSIILAADGTIFVRKGIAVTSLPQIPALQQGEILLANIYFDHRENNLVDENLFPLMGDSYICNVSPTAEDRLPKTMAKLRNGEKVRILAWGDSVTAGAYLPENVRWPQQFVGWLKERFPKADIELIVEAWGGYSTQMYMIEPPGSPLNYEEQVVAVHPDLIVTEFVNDAAMSASLLQSTYTQILNDMRGMGTEMLIIAPHYVRPDWMGLTSQKNIDNDPRPYIQFLRDFTNTNHISLADASMLYGKLWRQGIPYNIMMENCINHPDERGMAIFLQALKAVFPSVDSRVTGSCPLFSELRTSSTSLIKNGSASYVNTESTDPANWYGAGGLNYLNDGVLSNAFSQQALCDVNYTVTYYLNTSVNMLGYDLSSVRTIAYWGDGRRYQKYELLVRKVGSSSFISLGTFEYMPSINTCTTQLVLRGENNGLLITGVDAVQFKFAPIPGFGGTVYSEIDVEGSPRMLGDANLDGAVDVGDLGILAANYGSSGKMWAQGDFNGDGRVDVGDLGILAAHYGQGSTNSANFSADYAIVFGTTEKEDSADQSAQSGNVLCSELGLPLVVGLAMMGLVFIKLEQ